MNDLTFQKLEFEQIRGTLASLCSCELGKRLALKLVPTSKPHLVRQWLDQVRELAAVAETHSLPPFGGVHDIREEVTAAGFPTPLEPESIARIGETLDATGNLNAWFALFLDSAPALRGLGERIGDYSRLSVTINDSIDSRGEVRDYASEKLGRIRAAITRARDQIRAHFDRITRQGHLSKMLQYASATFHNDRMVLPLKAEYRGRVPGIVHRTSDSGATLFVEPAESVELNNDIMRLREEEQKEITRVLTGLCHKISGQARGIAGSLQAMAVLDLISAKCRYAKMRRCICPELDDTGRLELHEARHPVLLELFAEAALPGEKPKEVVPIDVRLGDDFDVLVITGPNTGGKTVALKTVGMLVLMAQAGIPIPVAEGSRLPVFGNVFVDIGDEQSLQQSLSTFSSHLSNQLSILNQSGPETLVLIDELGAGTDPDEGAAIGQAILAELLQRSAKAVVTTHLSALKAVAFTQPRVDNASVEFDAASLKPTYRLRLGEPGNSNALIIAKRLGMPARMVQAAKDKLDDRHRMLSKAIEGTLQSRREAEDARRKAREVELEARRRLDEYEQSQKDLHEERATFERWTQWVNALKPGDDVFVRSMRRPAKVVRMQLHKQTALVSRGSMDIEVPLRDIEMAPPE